MVGLVRGHDALQEAYLRLEIKLVHAKMVKFPRIFRKYYGRV